MPNDTFKGGDRAMDYLDGVLKKASNATSVSVGFLAGATYPDGKSVPMIAAIQEFGSTSRGIPPRPFFRTMVAAHKAEWGPQMGKLLDLHGYDAAKVLGLMGEKVAGQLRQSIRDTNSPPLAPATVKRKGFSKPLIDTGHMFQSVDFEIAS